MNDSFSWAFCSPENLQSFLSVYLRTKQGDALVKEVFTESPGVDLLERFMIYFLVKTVLGWKIYRACSSGDYTEWKHSEKWYHEK